MNATALIEAAIDKLYTAQKEIKVLKDYVGDGTKIHRALDDINDRVCDALAALGE